MKCLHPVTIRRNDGYLDVNGFSAVLVPCGRCAVCRKERSKIWATRLMLESLYYEDCSFVTLTYDDENLKYTPSGLATLTKDDVQRWMKRLRKKLPSPIKYYLVGEYGDRTFRPHYHVILFGVGIQHTSVIEETWNLGRVDVGDVTLASCNYVAGYVQKKLYGDLSKEVYFDRLAPFSLMSKGLGLDYLEDNVNDFINGESIRYRGNYLKTPRYFWRKLKESDFETSWRVNMSKRSKSEEMKNNMIEDYARRGVVDLSEIRIDQEIQRENREARLSTMNVLNPSKGNL